MRLKPEPCPGDRARPPAFGAKAALTTVEPAPRVVKAPAVTRCRPIVLGVLLGGINSVEALDPRSTAVALTLITQSVCHFNHLTMLSDLAAVQQQHYHHHHQPYELTCLRW